MNEGRLQTHSETIHDHATLPKSSNKIAWRSFEAASRMTSFWLDLASKLANQSASQLNSLIIMTNLNILFLSNNKSFAFSNNMSIRQVDESFIHQQMNHYHQIHNQFFYDQFLNLLINLMKPQAVQLFFYNEKSYIN